MMPVGLCRNWTQLDDLLIFCPPGPPPNIRSATLGDGTFDEGFIKVGFEQRRRGFAGGEFGFVGRFCLEGLCGGGEGL